ncbi:MAG: hypothetical protein QGG40_02180, partial [Myxococcota bacterium]|nr:hypothetical protein [Myxococcota bacterium]
MNPTLPAPVPDPAGERTTTRVVSWPVLAFLTLASGCSDPKIDDGDSSSGDSATTIDSADTQDSTDTAPDVDPWCTDPAEAIVYEEVGTEWGVVDTTD